MTAPQLVSISLGAGVRQWRELGESNGCSPFGCRSDGD